MPSFFICLLPVFGVITEVKAATQLELLDNDEFMIAFENDIGGHQDVGEKAAGLSAWHFPQDLGQVIFHYGFSLITRWPQLNTELQSHISPVK